MEAITELLMATGVTLDLVYRDKIGFCENNHEVKIQSNGYGFCQPCAAEISGYSTLYRSAIKDGQQPVELEE